MANKKLSNANKPLKNEETLLRYLGITLGIPFNSCRGKLDAYWLTSASSNHVFNKQSYGEDFGLWFGITKGRFFDLRFI